MVALPRLKALEEYTTQELAQARQLSPAVDRYLNGRGDDLGEFRRKSWLEASLATILQGAGAEAVTRAWSAAAEHLLRECWVRSGFAHLPACLFGLGKLGAEELNLSSDVDVVLIAEPAALEDAHAALKKFRSLLSGDAGAGLLRVDFDLRPGGRFGPIISTPSQFIDYYWNQGETWERLAWVRARRICGSEALADDLLESMRAFCYRRYLDFSVIEDLKLLRNRIHASVDLGENQIHLKLGPGGIRDIELFVHSLLIIHGGRRKDIRTHSTPAAIERLRAAGLLKPEDAAALIESYWRLREFENLVQAYDDQQTHILNLGPGQSLVGPKDQERCQETLKRVDLLVSSLLGPIQTVVPPWPQDEASQIAWLEKKGFSKEVSESVWPQLLSATALGQKSERDESFRREFLNRFVDSLSQIHMDRDLGLQTLLDFVRAVRAKSTFFAMLLREPRLIRDLSQLFSVSPYLGSLVSSRPELLDSFLMGKVGPTAGDWENYLVELGEIRQLSELAAAAQFLSSHDCDRFCNDLSQTADEICGNLLQRLQSEGPASSARIFALGKWGGRELGVRSDLDFLLVTDETPKEGDHRLARRFISRLTESQRGGRIYAIDLRLRPSGQAGPLLVSLGQLRSFLRERAEAWQRQAYLRVRPLGEPTIDLSMDIFARPLTANDLDQLRDIRTKLLRPKSADGFDLKYGPGGLLSIEFCTQIAVLKRQIAGAPADTLGMIRCLARSDAGWQLRAHRLDSSYRHLRTIEQLHQLTSHQSGALLTASSPSFQRLALAAKLTPEDLAAQLSDRMDRIAEDLAELDPLI